MNIEALRIVRQCVPTIGLALCRTLNEKEPLRRVCKANVELCVALNLPRGSVVALALRNSDRELLAWALDKGLPRHHDYFGLLRSDAATLAMAIDRGLIEFTDPARANWFRGLSHENGEALMDAIVQCNVPVPHILEFMERWQIDALPKHATYFQRINQHPLLAAALLGAGVWKPDLGLPLGEFFCRAAIRQRRLDALDHALRHGCLLHQHYATHAHHAPNTLDWASEAPDLVTWQALVVRGCRKEVDYVIHMTRWGNLELTQHMIKIGIWNENTVAWRAYQSQRWNILEWLASLRNAADLIKAERIFSRIREPDYLEKAVEDQVWTLDCTLRRLAWAKLQRAKPELQDSIEFGKPDSVEFFVTQSWAARGKHLVECQTKGQLLAVDDPATAIRTQPDWYWLEFVYLMQVNDYDVVPLLIGKRRQTLLEQCKAEKRLTAAVAERLAETGDLSSLRWIRDQGCALSVGCYLQARRNRDSEMIAWLESIEAPMGVEGSVSTWEIKLTVVGNQLCVGGSGLLAGRSIYFTLSDDWVLRDDALCEGNRPVFRMAQGNITTQEWRLACVWFLDRIEFLHARRNFTRTVEHVQQIRRLFCAMHKLK